VALAWLGNPLAGPPSAQSLKEGGAAVGRARAAGAKTPRERDYIAAIELFYKDADKVDHRTRALAYEKAMEQLAARYRDDREAAIFYALALNVTLDPSDKSYANQLKAAAILEKVFAEQPNHPGVAHYLIHSYDFPPIAEKGLPAARRYASIAPSAPHAQHMPSHIFTRVGAWQESIDTNRASARTAMAALRDAQTGLSSYEALHAYDYMMYAYLQLGKDKDAKALMEDVGATRKVNVDHFAGAFALAAVPARYTLERARWAEAAALTLSPRELPWERFPQAESITWFARGIGAARSGGVLGAKADLARLDTLRDTLTAAKNNYWAQQSDPASRRGRLDRVGGGEEPGGAHPHARRRHPRRLDREASGDARSDQAGPGASRRDAPGASGPGRGPQGVRGLPAHRSEPLPGSLWRGAGSRTGRRRGSGEGLLQPAPDARPDWQQ
jgi:hypothetical protein